MSEYLDLYEAIWEKAVNDDMYIVTIQLYNHAFNCAYEFYISKLKKSDIDKDDKRFNKFKDDTFEYCRIKTREIEGRVRELVYQEAQDWPYNKDYKLRDKEYNTKLNSLRLEVCIYAKEKMKKCWYKL